MNTSPSKTVKKEVRKQFVLTPGEQKALKELKLSGYCFPGRSEIAVLRQMLADTWKKQFPDKPFPSD